MKRMRRPSQETQILAYMREHKTITPVDAYREIGCLRLAARIADIERSGHKVTRQRIKVMDRNGEMTSVTAYGLEEEA